MGYRSHVLLAVDAALAVDLRLAHPEMELMLSDTDMTHHMNRADNTPYVIFEWTQIKWHPSTYASIRAIEDWMDERELLDEDEYGFMFLRDGEEINDLEHRGSWNYGLTYGIGIEDDPAHRLTDKEHKAIAIVLAAIDGEWGEYIDPDVKNACKLLEPLQLRGTLQDHQLIEGEQCSHPLALEHASSQLQLDEKLPTNLPKDASP